MKKKPIDVLVNMAGIAHYGLFQMASSNVMHEVMQVNYFSAMILCQNVLKSMSKNGCGCIINVASVAAMDSHQGDSIYGASKAALCQSSRVMAAENGKNGIRVNVIAPGPTDTDMIALHRDKIGEAIVQNCSMGRLGRKEEIAQVALFLASEKAGFINGQIIRVDGGSL